MKHSFTFNLKEEDFRYKVIDKRKGKIAITPFEVKDFYTNYPKCKEEGFISEDYAFVDTKQFSLLLSRLNLVTLRLLIVMVDKLPINSNICKFRLAEYSNIFSNGVKHTYDDYLRPLIDNNVIVKCNRKCTYIINHNIFFKGDLNQFSKDYKDIYKDRKVEYIEEGKINIDG